MGVCLPDTVRSIDDAAFSGRGVFIAHCAEEWANGHHPVVSGDMS